MRLVNDCLGKYDYFAIRWLYGDIAGARTPAEEQKALSEMLREKAGDPAYYYGNYWYDYYFGDVRLAYYNLGDDPVKRTRYRFENLRTVARHAAEWLEGRDADGSYRTEAIAALSTGVREMVSYMAAYIGGVYYTEVTEGDGQTMLRVVPKEEQRRYVKETLKAIEDLSWLDTKLTEGQLANLPQAVQADCLGTLMKRMETLPRYQNGLPGAYTPGEMAADMAGYIFRDVKAGRKLSDYNRQLQQAFTGVIIGGSKVLAEPKSARGRAAAFAAADEEVMQPAFPYEATATLEPISAYGKYRMAYYAKDFSEHVYYGMLLQLRDIYRQGVAAASDASSRDFCRYMLRRIENSLKTD